MQSTLLYQDLLFNKGEKSIQVDSNSDRPNSTNLTLAGWFLGTEDGPVFK